LIYTVGIDSSEPGGLMARIGIGKLFRNGRSQAVRLPQEFRFRGDRVRLRKVDKGVLMEAILDVPAWFAELDRLGPEPFMEDRAQPEAPARRVFD
jgi:antitoxin VapB